MRIYFDNITKQLSILAPQTKQNCHFLKVTVKNNGIRNYNFVFIFIKFMIVFSGSVDKC